MSEQNLEHQRAKYAYKCIENVPSGLEESYKTQVMKCRYLIYRTGLMQTLTYYCSKMDEKHKQFRLVALHLLNWILDGKKINGRDIDCATCNWGEDDTSTIALYKWLLDQPDDDAKAYYTQRAMDVADWLKRYGEMKLK